MAQIVSDDIIAVSVVLVELIISCLGRTLLLFLHDIVWVKHGLMFSLCIQTELLLATRVCLGGREVNHGLRELIRLEVLAVACFLDLVDRRICSLAEQNMHHLAS